MPPVAAVTRPTPPAPSMGHVVWPFVCLPTKQAGESGQGEEGSGSGMGELGDTGTKPAPLLQHPAPLVIGAVTTQVVHLVESGGFGIRPEGLKDKRQVGDPHVVLCLGSHRG